jgi:hypothetical protein
VMDWGSMRKMKFRSSSGKTRRKVETSSNRAELGIVRSRVLFNGY